MNTTQKSCALAIKAELTDLAKTIIQQIVTAGRLEELPAHQRRRLIIPASKRHVTLIFIPKLSDAAAAREIGAKLVDYIDQLLRASTYFFEPEAVTVIFGKSTSLVPTQTSKNNITQLHNALVEYMHSLDLVISADTYLPHVALKRGVTSNEALLEMNRYLNLIQQLSADNRMRFELVKSSLAVCFAARN